MNIQQPAQQPDGIFIYPTLQYYESEQPSEHAQLLPEETHQFKNVESLQPVQNEHNVIPPPKTRSKLATIVIYTIFELIWIIWQCGDLFFLPVGLYIAFLIAQYGIFLMIIGWIIGIGILVFSFIIFPSVLLTRRVIEFEKLPRKAKIFFLVVTFIEMIVGVIGVIIAWIVTAILGCRDRYCIGLVINITISSVGTVLTIRSTLYNLMSFVWNAAGLCKASQ